MSRPSSSSYNISNEHVVLVDMLKQMYNDNIHQINNMTNSINNLRNTNNQIRNILLQVLLYPNTSNNLNINNDRNIANERTRTSERNRTNNRNQRQTTERTNFGRVILDNVPYVIDSIQQYTIPLTNSVSNTNTSEHRNTNYSRLMQSFFQPVDVYPTQSQIEIATRNVRYCDIVNPVNRSCPISLDTFVDSDMVSVIRFCGHIFRRDQLNTWFMSNCRCPVCRYDIRNYNSNTPSSILESSNIIDLSNNLTNENTSHEPIEERNISDQSQDSSTPNTTTSYLDLILDNTFNEFSNLSNVTDPTTLLTLLQALQTRPR